MAPNPKTKHNVQTSTTKEDKPVVSMIEKDGPIADSPLAIDLGEYPEGPPQDSLSGITPSEHKTPCERPHCKHCERRLVDYLSDVLPNNDNPKSRPRTPRSSTQV